jgi:zinc/manganese transport system permease protein
VTGLAHWVIEPGFLASDSVRTAFLVGSAVAVVSGLVGVFTVIRGQSFAGEALADVGATGGSGAFLLGVSPLWGFIGIAVAASGVIELIGSKRRHNRDLATGIVLGAGLGLAALFLYWDTTWSNTTGASMTILFGSMFLISPSAVPFIVGLSLFVLAVVLAQYRRLLLTSLNADLAAARGVSVRAAGIWYLAALAVAVSLSAVTIGSVLSTALLIGPAATALRVTRRPGRAMAVSALLGLVATWVGILLAYDSYYWTAQQRGWPVSSFVVALVFVFYLLTLLPRRGGPQSTARRTAAGPIGA